MISASESLKTKDRLTLAAAAAATALALAATAHAGDEFEMMVHKDDVYGARAVEAGDFEKAIQRLERRLGDDGRQSNSIRSPVLIDLCVAYTMAGRVRDAETACDAAVETGWSSGLAYNNRGVLHVARGNYTAALQDFERAVEAHGADTLARRNLDRVRTVIARNSQQPDGTPQIAVAQADPAPEKEPQ